MEQVEQEVTSSPNLKYCDVVMKGGITSGVVYPKAVAELAKSFRFKNVGGTSAGAIAAAVVAAAEYGRRSGDKNAFDIVEALPENLASNGKLLALFSPNQVTRKTFAIALGLIGPQSKSAKVLKTILGIWMASPLTFVALLFISFALGCGASLLTLFSHDVSAARTSGWQWVFSVVTSLILGFLLSLIGCSIVGFFKAVRSLASNGFGLCSGTASRSGKEEDSLSGWIHTQIQAAAGRTSGPALTFGDLWNAPSYPGETLQSERTINLQVVTTNVTQGRPYSIPFSQRVWLFDPEEMRSILPGHVVDQMVAASPKIPEQPSTGGTRFRISSPLDEKRELIRLPEAKDLPILLATRMSLSFPVLLSAVPLYVVDHSIKRNQPHSQADLESLGFKTKVGTKMWFSDGGICSNFPISFFDSPVPRWPTFGITLQPISAKKGDPDADLVEMTQPNREGRLTWNNLGDPTWTPSGVTESREPLDCLARFGSAILNTMQDWRDNLQAIAPGFRERIVTIRLRPDEGGLNLNMSKDLIETLGNRGSLAGERLQNEFEFPPQMFIRFRTMLAALQNYLREFRRTMTDPVPGQDDQGLRYIHGQDPPQYYPWPQDLRQRAEKAATDLIELTGSFESTSDGGEGFSKGAPRPLSQLENTLKF